MRSVIFSQDVHLKEVYAKLVSRRRMRFGVLLFLCFSSCDASDPLILTPFIAANKIEEAKQLSQVGRLRGVNVPSYSGYFTVNETTGSNLFFWFFPALSNSLNAPTILWLQGGPGSSSLLGLFQLNGPYEADKQLRLSFRKQTLIQQFNLLYIDQPVGTGFSYTEQEDGYVKTFDQAALDLYEALRQFFTIFNEYSKTDFYVTGESFAGKFVPATAHVIHNEGEKANMKLAGIVVVDGLCDPPTMMDYGEFLLNLGLIDENQAKHFKTEEDEIRALLAADKKLEALHLWVHLIDSDKVTQPLTYYNNVTGFKNKFNFLYAKNPMVRYYPKFLALKETKEAIHVSNRPFNNGSLVDLNLFGDIMVSVKPYVTELMENYKVMIINGQLDVLVPYPQTRKFVNSIEWTGAEEFSNVERIIWYNQGSRFEPAGYVRQVKSFVEIMIRNAGHMVPADQPENFYDAMDRFIHGKSFKENLNVDFPFEISTAIRNTVVSTLWLTLPIMTTVNLSRV